MKRPATHEVWICVCNIFCLLLQTHGFLSADLCFVLSFLYFAEGRQWLQPLKVPCYWLPMRSSHVSSRASPHISHPSVCHSLPNKSELGRLVLYWQAVVLVSDEMLTLVLEMAGPNKTISAVPASSHAGHLQHCSSNLHVMSTTGVYFRAAYSWGYIFCFSFCLSPVDVWYVLYLYVAL